MILNLMLPFSRSPSRCYRFRSSMFPYSMLTSFPTDTNTHIHSLSLWHTHFLTNTHTHTNTHITFPFSDTHSHALLLSHPPAPPVFRCISTFTDFVARGNLVKRRFTLNMFSFKFTHSWYIYLFIINIQLKIMHNCLL